MSKEFKHSKEEREKWRRYYAKNREKRLAQVKAYCKRNRAKISAREKAFEKASKLKVAQFFGSKCTLCSYDGGEELKCIVMHEVHGQKHHCGYRHVWKYKENFSPLCFKCHNMVHRMMVVFGMTWEQILALRDSVNA